MPSAAPQCGALPRFEGRIALSVLQQDIDHPLGDLPDSRSRICANQLAAKSLVVCRPVLTPKVQTAILRLVAG
jgi:hypothetical protein